jgi:hypothetical protein
MKRKFVILILTLILVLVLHYWGSMYTRGVSDNMAGLLVDLSDVISSHDWDAARQLIQPLSKTWQDTCAPMDWWISRVITESIHTAIRELVIAVELEDYYESRVLAAELADMLSQLSDWYELTLSNVV